MAVTLLATQCPAIQVPGAFVSLGLPLSGTGLATATYAGSTGSARMDAAHGLYFNASWNGNAGRIDMGDQFGGGAFAIVEGLGLVVPGSGLAGTVNAGHAQARGLLEVAVSGTAVPGGVTDNARTWIWLTADSAEQAIITPVATSLTPPANARVLLGSFLASGGNITAQDTSGVPYLYNNHLWRSTADLGPPLDTPPASVRIYTSTLDSVYFWDGAVHRAWNTDLAMNDDTIPTASTVFVPAGKQVVLWGPIVNNGVMTNNGRILVL